MILCKYLVEKVFHDHLTDENVISVSESQNYSIAYTRNCVEICRVRQCDRRTDDGYLVKGESLSFRSSMPDRVSTNLTEQISKEIPGGISRKLQDMFALLQPATQCTESNKFA